MNADDTDKSKTTGKSGKHFSGPVDTATCIKEAAKMNMATAKFAELAQQKAQSSELKQFAQKLGQDHKQAQTELETIARKHNVTVPTAVDSKCQEEISRLEALSGQEFDREFAKGAVEGHAMAVAHLQHATREAKDADLRQYTQKLLAKVKEHQQRGREVAKSVGIDQSTIASLESKAQEGVGTPGAQTEAGVSSSTRTENQKPNEPKN